MQTPAERHRDVSAAVSKWVIPDLAKLAADYESPITIIHKGNNTYFHREFFPIWTVQIAISHKRVTIQDQKMAPNCSSEHDIASASFKRHQGRNWKEYTSPQIIIREINDHPGRSSLTATYRLADRWHTYEVMHDEPPKRELLFRHLDELSGSDSVQGE